MNKQTIDISIIIVNWNTKQLLLDCIKSLKAETKKALLEIIVVDNGSRDGSQQALMQAYPDVILVENGENLGFSRANNIGIRLCTGRYICLVNSDIVALDCCLDKLLAYMDSRPAAGACGPKTLDKKLMLQPNCRYFPTIRNAFCDNLFLKKLFPNASSCRGRTLKKSSYNQIHSAEVLSGCFLMLRREVIEKVGLLDERFFFYGEDTDWCKRIYKAGWELIFYSEASVIHYGGSSTANAPVKYLVEMEKADLQYWKKHHHPVAWRIYCSIRATHHVLYGIAWGLLFLLKTSHKDHYALRAQGHFRRLAWLTGRRKSV